MNSNTKLANRREVAVLIPCFNEGEAIMQVVEGFRYALPQARIFIYDNNSSDDTMEQALASGAIVRREPLQGKGNVVRRMFADIEADIYVLVDGDATYDPASAPLLIEKLVHEQLDMVVGVRLPAEEEAAFRRGHRVGNTLLTSVVSMIFGNRFTDILSGYRVFSRRFVKSFPALAREFEIETELTVHALELRMPVAELPTPYRVRPEGSMSKLRTYRDGLHILSTVLVLFKEERPLLFFSLLFALLSTFSLILAYPILVTYLETGLVPRLPTAILATGTMLLAFLSLAIGLILETVTRGRREMKRMSYLAIPTVTE